MTLGEPETDNHRRTGKVNGTQARDILLDTGADISVVAEELLDRDYRRRGSVMLKPIASQAIRCPATMVPVEMGSRTFTVKAAVMPRRELGCNLLLGQNIPDVPLHQLAAETVPSSGVGTKTILQPAVAPEEEANPNQEDQPEETQMDQFQGRAEEQAITPLSIPQDTQTEPEGDQETLHMVNVVTRAQAKTVAQQEEADRLAEQTFGSAISSWEDITTDGTLPEVPDEEPTEATLATTQANCGRATFIKQQRDNPSLREYWVQARDNPGKPYSTVDGILVRLEKDALEEMSSLIVVPQQQRRKVFQEAHSSPLGGHFGYRKTKAKVKRNYYWPGLNRDLKRWTEVCDKCQKGNKSKTNTAPLVPLPVISTPWERVAFDVVGPLPRSRKGHRYLLTSMDFASRYPEATSLKRIDAVTVAEAMVATYTRFGIPAEILTDNGSCFVNALQSELCRMLGITSIKISPHNPCSNGMLE